MLVLVSLSCLTSLVAESLYLILAYETFSVFRLQDEQPSAESDQELQHRVLRVRVRQEVSCRESNPGPQVVR